MTQDPVVIRNLVKRYPDFTLDGISLTIRRGFVTGFIGANGSGKTTTIKSALGAIQPDEGDIDVIDHHKIGVVLDTPPYFGEWRVRDLEKCMARFYSTWNAELFDARITRAHIERSQKIKELSRGMAMQLQMAIALAHAPDLLILDEATSGLDPLARSELVNTLREFMLDENHSVWFSTHITSDLESLADYLIVIDRGSIFAQTTKDEVLDDFRLVKGTPAQLTPDIRERSLGLEETPAGWQALLHTSDASAYASDAIIEHPTIEDISICVARGSEMGALHV